MTAGADGGTGKGPNPTGEPGSGSGPQGTTNFSTSGMPDDATPGSTLPAAPGARYEEVVARRSGMFGTTGSGDTSGYGGLVQSVSMPPASEAPYGGWFDEVAQALAHGLAERGLPDAVEKVVVDRGEITFFIRRERLLETARLLRDADSLRFEMCLGVSGVHFPGEQGRELHAIYHLLSLTHNRRIRLEVVCPETDPHVPSVVAVYPTNDWHERETYDFFGIVFDGHPALTRIEMPDDWPGHPQRKDYPLGGIPVEYKGATIPPPDTRRSYN